MKLEQFAYVLVAMGVVVACGNDGTSSTNTAVGGAVVASGGSSGSVAMGGQAIATSTSSSGASIGGASTGGASTAMTTGPLLTAAVSVSGETPKPVSPLFFGQNYWSWVPSWGDAVAKVEAQTKQLGLRFLRAGGANNDKQNPIAFFDPDGMEERPSGLDQVGSSALVGALFGLRGAVSFCLGQPPGFFQDQLATQLLVEKGELGRALQVASGFGDYFDIHREGASQGSSGWEQSGVMLGHAIGTNQLTAGLYTGETRQGQPMDVLPLTK